MAYREVREALEGGRVKGGVFKSHLEWVRTHHPNDLPALISRLPDEMQSDLSAPLSTSWYPFAWLIALDRLIAEMFGGGKLEVIRELGRHSASINLSGAYRVFNRDNVHDFFARSAPLHNQFQDFGRVAYQKLGEKEGVISHTVYPCFSPIYCASAIGYYEKSSAINGALRPEVRETSCQCLGDDACTFQMSWS